jgi:hypothetical protein
VKKLITALAIILAACSPMPHKQVEGLENLKTTVHVLEPEEIWAACQDAYNVNLFYWPLACAKIRFDLHTCDLYVATNTPAHTFNHEMLHCKGMDHGEGIQEAYDRWKAMQ